MKILQCKKCKKHYTLHPWTELIRTWMCYNWIGSKMCGYINHEKIK